MVNTVLVRKREQYLRTPADIFKAAATNDPVELKLALSDGQKLDLVDEETGFTPIMVAILEHSEDFLAAAIKEDFNPWHRDPNERLAIDHANALGMRDVQRALYMKMYPQAHPVP